MKRIKEKGFTLVELLAVIVILAVIALIATPQILRLIEDSRKGSFKATAEGIIKSAEQTYAKDSLEEAGKIEKVYNFTSGSNIGDLDLKGEKPSNGYLRVNKEGESELLVHNNKYCALKSYSDYSVNVFDIENKLCNTGMNGNLITNGYGEFADNTNFPQFSYRKDENSYLSYTEDVRDNLFGSEFIKVDTNKKYTMSLDVRGNNNAARHWVGFYEYDIDKNRIEPAHYRYISGTLTTLTRDLKDGDTVVYLKDITSFKIDNTTAGYQRGFIFWNYKDSRGTEYPELTYSRNTWSSLYDAEDVDKITHVISLNSKWNHGTIPAGTKLSQSESGEYTTCLLFCGDSLSTQWKNYSNSIAGVNTTGTFTNSKFRPGTKYIKPVINFNYYSIPSTTFDMKNFIFKEID